MSTFRNAVKVLLRHVGRAVGPYAYLAKYTFAHHLSRLIQRQHVDCVLDVGANTGLYRRFLRTEVGYSGLILSFEPVQANVDHMRRAGAKDSKWHVFDFALGAERTLRSIHVMQSGLFSSFLEPDASTVSDFKSLNAIARDEEVSVERLDDHFREWEERFGFRRPMLKIDTQGFDLAVLQGASSYLSRFALVQTEASIRPLYRDMPDFLSIYAHLAERGFSLSGFSPVVSDRHLRLVELDWTFVNDRLCIDDQW